MRNIKSGLGREATRGVRFVWKMYVFRVFGSLNGYANMFASFYPQYEPDDLVMKSGNCIHWQHKACLEVRATSLCKFSFE